LTPGKALIFPVTNNADPVLESVQQISCSVCRRIVHDHGFKLPVILGEHELKTLADVASAVKGNNRNRNQPGAQADLTRLK
jgi:hypothetical protein